MTIFFDMVALIYAASLCFVITLFTRTLLRERKISTATVGTVLEVSPAQVVEKSSRSDAHASAKTA